VTEWSGVPPFDPALREAVREIEEHVASEGWDRPARLFALVDTVDLVRREPELARAMGIEPQATGLSAVEQEAFPAEVIEEALLGIEWPDGVVGCAAVVERFVLPPSAEAQLPDDDRAALVFAAEHPEREEVRIVAGATRAGTTYCAIRMRSHDDHDSVLEAPDLVPTLLELLLSTFQSSAAAERHETDRQDQ
jgi:hypothetical protein